jgi:predicted P-loop ATPase/GTPase
MPSAQTSVRVISRKQREPCVVEGSSVSAAKTDREVEREIVQTVASWIKERRTAVKEFARANSAMLSLGSNWEREGS